MPGGDAIVEDKDSQSTVAGAVARRSVGRGSTQRPKLAKPPARILPRLVALSPQHTGLIVRFAAKDDCIVDSQLNIVRHRT